MIHFNDSRDWFFIHRFGLFIHWGIYAVGGRHEQELQRYQTPTQDYEAYARSFKPDRFNPDQWLDVAQEAGMSYLVFTAKHHDGFCMWDTKATDYQIMNTPCGRDLLADLAQACQKRNFPLELYYSCVDWHHPAYPNLGRHHEIVTDTQAHNPQVYLDYVRTQIRELCTNYGDIAGIWWDMNVPQWEAPDIHDMIRQLQPGAMINNRGYGPGDYSTPERDFNPVDTSIRQFQQPTEACDSVGINSWGFRQEEDYYTPDTLKRRMTRILARDGNYLLNVGPQPNGEFPQPSQRILRSLGTWYKRVGKALTAPPLPWCLENKNLFLTGEGNVLNVIVNDPLQSTTLDLAPLAQLPREAVLLNTGDPLDTTLTPIVYLQGHGPGLRLRNLPPQGLGAEPAVIRLTFDQDVSTLSVPMGDQRTVVQG